MDLLLIARKIWRYRIVTLPVIALTLLGAFYVVVLKAPVYEASSSYILINPPSPPTPEEIAQKPALGRINPDNPYTRFSDQSVVVGLLSSILSNDVERRALTKQGADSRYTVAPVQSTYGYSSLMLGITGVGSSGPQAHSDGGARGGCAQSRAREPAGVSGRSPSLPDQVRADRCPGHRKPEGERQAPGPDRRPRPWGRVAVRGHLRRRGPGHAAGGVEQARTISRSRTSKVRSRAPPRTTRR